MFKRLLTLEEKKVVINCRKGLNREYAVCGFAISAGGIRHSHDTGDWSAVRQSGRPCRVAGEHGEGNIAGKNQDAVSFPAR